ncbi:UBA domain-containing protein [Caenorhabditis elegans]|uniref:UBA domain-containing protein n=2 Tax=Caenorhabditis elegans TaxID=6239 RepID=X5MBH3_CAEEL|nr:UBA domain-containing protein [Caenorhabditis elegans]CDO50126.1 UBA domain-containing protein [Caenorhabditis elegans]|eukprot:NP_001293398.1 Uncharacterized protein CELE_Y51F10.10 [Caenorhabditis elegans]
MSFNDVFHDYIKDIPMDISRKFYPTRNINVDFIQIPDLRFTKFEYSFEAETRAREQFDKQNEPIVLDSTSTKTTTTASPPGGNKNSGEVRTSESRQSVSGYDDVLSQNVLVPCPVNSNPSMTSSSTKPSVSNTSAMVHSLHEFESTNNVFDDIQILALDDRKALQEQQKQHEPINNNNNTEMKPKKLEKAEKTAKNSDQQQHEELRKRLLTKGYRADIVEKALRCLPKSRLVHIEYYMKACRTVEKTGKSSIDETLPFLIQCNLSDKMVILSYSEVCSNLLKMGFPRPQIFEAVAVEKGDQNRALSRLLPNS